MIGSLAFAAPLALASLVALPALWYLLRLTPPPPRRLPLPTLPLVRDLIGREREPSRTPWWLLMLRLAAAAALILSVAGPQWRRDSNPLPAANGPVILMLDDGFAAAPGWKARIERAARIVNDAASQPITLIIASEERPQAVPEGGRTVLARLMSLAPQPVASRREAMLDAAGNSLASDRAARVVWLSDGLADASEQALIDAFLANHGSRVAVIRDETLPTMMSGAAIAGDGVEAILRRAGAGAAEAGLVRAYDDRGRLLGDAAFALGAESREARAKITLPLELMNEIARLDIADARHAGAVQLMDASSRRRRVALISGETTDTAQPLVSARFFVARAIQPYADLREPPRGTADPIARALEERPDVLVLTDIGTFSADNAAEITRFVENGGMLIRFAGPGLAAASDDLLPVRLRRGGRTLGGALSWEKPQQMAPFPEGSPFLGLPIRDRMQVERQVLAEPDSDISRASWAVLEDGTPLVTGASRGRGHLVLFHVTADTSWSSLPISGLFVDMLRRCLQIASGRSEGRSEGGTERLAPRLTLNGFGALSTASAQARPIDPRHIAAATRAYPPGFYGPPEASLAVNAVTMADDITAARFGAASVYPLHAGDTLDLRPILATIGVILLILDGLAVLRLLSGGLRNRRTTAAMLTLTLGALISASGVDAQTQRPVPAPLPRVSVEEMRSSLKPRLAFVITGNASVDESSRLGLQGLGAALAQRTAITLDDPVGVDPATDELVFFPMLYWPVLPDQIRPPEGAIRALDNFMRNGGTVVFDTRDAFVNRPGSQPSSETRALRRMLSTLDIPSLEPVPADHVLTKTFYLLDRMVGRYVAGDTWVEAISSARDAKVPARAGDRVSPIVITGNDFASAWAVDRLGRPVYPLVPGEPRQREFAIRTGINLVMYVMTGNYKADQVHVPALLERLGQ